MLYANVNYNTTDIMKYLRQYYMEYPSLLRAMILKVTVKIF